jgi:hypothetical protein
VGVCVLVIIRVDDLDATIDVRELHRREALSTNRPGQNTHVTYLASGPVTQASWSEFH